MITNPASDRQMRYIDALARELGWGRTPVDRMERLRNFVFGRFGFSLALVTRDQAREVIGALEDEQRKEGLRA